MIAEVISFFLLYYVSGLMMTVLFFHNEYLWHLPVSEHGVTVVAGMFLFVLIWPIMMIVVAALSVRHQTRHQRCTGAYYGN